MMLVPYFLKYEVGDWTTVSLPDESLEVSAREHRVIMLADTIEKGDFDLLGKVNSDEFLGVAPGLLLCDDLAVSHVKCAQEEDWQKMFDGMIHADALPERTFLKWVFIEVAAVKWNEYLVPRGDGLAERREYPVHKAVDMAAFF